MLELNHIDTFYGRSRVLHDVSLTIGKGEVVAILGRNGVGKTSLLKCIMGLTDRTRGEIRLNGVEMTSKASFERARAGIGYVPQGREIIAEFTVQENILMGCYARSDGKVAIPRLVLKLFPYLQDNLYRRGGLLSGGQQQQLAFARALASDPNILLLDEPTEGIQPNIVEAIEETIVRLNQELGLTILLVEQKIDFARRVAPRFVILEKGHICAEGASDQMSDDLVHRHLMV